VLVGGQVVNIWDTISVILGSANRDEDVFSNADEFDIDRKGPSHITFGFGIHHCIGAALARLEIAVALRTISRRFPEAELVEGPIERRKNHMLRGPEKLFLRLGRDRG
jgi:cytochrome P450